jgi:hypothetical protein
MPCRPQPSGRIGVYFSMTRAIKSHPSTVVYVFRQKTAEAQRMESRENTSLILMLLLPLLHMAQAFTTSGGPYILSFTPNVYPPIVSYPAQFMSAISIVY